LQRYQKLKHNIYLRAIGNITWIPVVDCIH